MQKNVLLGVDRDKTRRGIMGLRCIYCFGLVIIGGKMEIYSPLKLLTLQTKPSNIITLKSIAHLRVLCLAPLAYAVNVVG